MKNIFLFLLVLSVLSINLNGQTKGTRVDVLYFKAQLSCCQARSCNALETDVKKVVDENFKDKNVTFKVIKLTDPANDELVKKYNAKSQTVILVSEKKGKVKTIDSSDIVTAFVKDKDFETFQKNLKEKITQLL